MNLLPDSCQTGRGPMMSVASWAKGSLTKGMLCKGAGTGFLPLPKSWQISQQRQKLLVSREMLGQKSDVANDSGS